MACQCGCSTAAPRAEVPRGADCECGCATSGSSEDMDVGALARMVRELDQRVRELEMATARD